MLALTQSTTFLIGPIAKLLGLIMEGIYRFLDMLNYPDIGLCIMIFTVVVYLCMFPLTLKTQKFSKMSQIMNPEIKAIQDKYKDKKDQDSMMQQNDEIRAVYEKYGTSPTGGCLQLIIQMPILFALYRVIMNIPAYVKPLKDIYESVALTIQGSSFADKFTDMVGSSVSKFNIGDSNKIIDGLYKFSTSQWKELGSCGVDAIEKAATSAYNELHPILTFFGINLSEAPSTIITNAAKNVGSDKSQILIIIVAVAIPVLAGVFQYLQTKLAPSTNTQQSGDDNAMMASMKTMNTIMPLMSAVFCFSFASGLGLYWAFGAFVRCVQQFFINKHLDKVDVNELIQKNLEKVNEKRAKSGLPPKTVSNAAKMNVKSTSFDNEKNKKLEEEKKAKREENIRKSSEYYSTSSESKAGSLRSKADMVKKYNEKNNKK